MSDNLQWLQDWYASQCNDDWEHTYGVRIGTIDNPGWSLEVDLAETDLENHVLESVEVSRSEEDWFTYGIRDQKFIGACGRRNLDDLIGAFRKVHEEVVYRKS